MNTNIKQYLPVFGMLFAAVLQALYTAVGDNRLTTVEVLTLFLALTGAVTTYVVPRLESATWLKPVTAGATAAGVAAVAGLSDGALSAQDWVTVGIQLLVGFGVVFATNKEVPVTPTDSTLRRAG